MGNTRPSILDQVYAVVKQACFTFLPATLWILAITLRPHVMHASCATHPSDCTPASVLEVDRFSVGWDHPEADEISFWGQIAAGTLSFSLVTYCSLLIWWQARRLGIREHIVSRSIHPLLVWFKAVFWNGLATETARLIVQRPRPFVYSNPSLWGANPAHYTSFYSGHTSFAAVSAIVAILTLRGVKMRRPDILAFECAFNFILLTTAACRVLSGRHFLTDVISAIIAGTLIGYWTYRLSLPSVSNLTRDSQTQLNALKNPGGYHVPN